MLLWSVYQVLKATTKRIKLFLNNLTTSQNKTNEYLQKNKNIQHATKSNSQWLIPSKIIRNPKRQDNMTCNGEKNQSTQNLQTSELADKNIKMIIITLFNIFKKLEERFSMISRNMGDVKDSHRMSRDENLKV